MGEEDGQMVFGFARSDSIIYTNIGQNNELDEKLIQAGGEEYLEAAHIIKLNHSRG